jgi:ribosomal protein S18 acetylase RimI-like enzyme
MDHTGVMAFTIRRARLSDMSELEDVFSKASMSNENDRPQLLKHPEWLELSDDAVREGRMQVAADESYAVVGFASYLITEGVAELVDLFVDPSHMRRGIGAALVRAICEQLEELDFESLDVIANQHAVAFYERVGFAADKVDDTEGSSALRMRKPIRGN